MSKNGAKNKRSSSAGAEPSSGVLRPIPERASRAVAPKPLGRSAVPRGATFVQTERSAHIAWDTLIREAPNAARLLHRLVSLMSKQNAVVVSQKTLASLLSLSDRTIRTSVAHLVARQFIQVVRLNGPGTVCAYVVNSRVAWSDSRDKLCLSSFSASVVADVADQVSDALESTRLRAIPALYALEIQSPVGDVDPPVQMSLDGLEPDLPFTEA